MASVNKVILVGYLGADPEMRQTSSGDPVCTLSVATSEKFKNRNGELQTATEWHKVVLFRRMAEIANQYLRKGSSAYFEGQMKTRKWTDKNGIERYTTEIEAEEMKMLGSRQNAASSSGGEAEYGGSMPSSDAAGVARGAAPGKKAPSFDDMDDDIPF